MQSAHPNSETVHGNRTEAWKSPISLMHAIIFAQQFQKPRKPFWFSFHTSHIRSSKKGSLL